MPAAHSICLSDTWILHGHKFAETIWEVIFFTKHPSSSSVGGLFAYIPLSEPVQMNYSFGEATARKHQHLYSFAEYPEIPLNCRDENTSYLIKHDLTYDSSISWKDVPRFSFSPFEPESIFQSRTNFSRRKLEKENRPSFLIYQSCTGTFERRKNFATIFLAWELNTQSRVQFAYCEISPFLNKLKLGIKFACLKCRTYSKTFLYGIFHTFFRTNSN